MTLFHRRFVLAALTAALALVVAPAWARTVTDSAGRQVDIPDHVGRVFAAGPPASILVYILAPQTMTGWVRAPRPEDKPFLLPAVRDLPETGRLTAYLESEGKGDREAYDDILWVLLNSSEFALNH